MKACGERLEATSTRHAPWYAVPADDKENARLVVSAIVLDALKELKMAYPMTTAKHRAELQSVRKQLANSSRNKLCEGVNSSGAWNQSVCKVLDRPCQPTLHGIRVHQTSLLELKATVSEYGEIRDSTDVVP
jgi:hypothetical protein